MAYRIIVVDDDTANLKIAGHILSRNGMHVTALRSGRALLHYLGEHLPDLILLDIKMPALKRSAKYGACRAVRRQFPSFS